MFQLSLWVAPFERSQRLIKARVTENTGLKPYLACRRIAYELNLIGTAEQMRDVDPGILSPGLDQIFRAETLETFSLTGWISNRHTALHSRAFA